VYVFLECSFHFLYIKRRNKHSFSAFKKVIRLRGIHRNINNITNFSFTGVFMKRFVTVLMMLAVATTLFAGGHKMIQRYNRLTNTWASYPEVTIHDIQYSSPDSLLVADALQNTVPVRWTLQSSPYIHFTPPSTIKTDTVVITALVVIPAKVITYTNKGYTMLLHDTASTGSFDGLFVRASSDTATHIADGFMNPEAGSIVRMTGVVSEFPTINMNSACQFQPIPGIAIDIVGTVPVSGNISKEFAIPMNVGDLYTGIFSGGKVKYSTGEPKEGMIVELTNLTIDNKVNPTRGTFSAQDASGNQITMYDASRYFTLKGTSTDHPIADPTWTTIYNSSSFVGTIIDTIRGFITVASGTESARGYRICPLYYGDIIFGHVLPSISTHRRYPIVVTPDTTVLITCKAYAQEIGQELESAVLYYSVDNGPFIEDTMTYNPVDSIAQATIPKFAANTFVKYFMKAKDNVGNEKIYASSASAAPGADTSKGCFFYTVLDRPMTIHDVQYTPFTNGRTPYLGAIVTVSGIVTVDTTQMSETKLSYGTSAWYIQSTNEPWNGIWVSGGTTEIMNLMHLGDSVSVTGTVTEYNDVTELYPITEVIVHSSSNPIPDPVEVTTGQFTSTVGNGTPTAEQWEGMRVTLTNLTVTSIYPYFSDPTIWEVDDGSGPIYVYQGGKNHYSNIPSDSTSGDTIIYADQHISYLTGIIFYSGNRYVIVPCSDADFGSITTNVREIPNALPAKYNLSENYPNPFNPTTRFQVNLPNAADLEVTVYNVLGQKVASLMNGHRSAGTYEVTWNGTNDHGTAVNSGVYFIRMQADNYTNVRKVLLVK
jgi:hypothetical protein